MTNKEILKQTTNRDLKDEIEARIKAGEWEIDTGTADTYGDSSVRYITSISYKDKLGYGEKPEKPVWRYLELEKLLEEQDEKTEQKRQEEIMRDNSRTEVWEKMEELVSFSIEKRGGWGSKNLIVECKQCGKMNEHVYLNWSKWEKTGDIRVSTILSMIEYEWEAHLVQGHERKSRAWNEERLKFPEYEEWLKNRK